jgi:hypothetical protein
MSDQTPGDPLTPGTERVERIEYIERVPSDATPPRANRESSPMWVWVLPLVLVAIALIWYVLSRGEPTSPVEIITLIADVRITAPLASHIG